MDKELVELRTELEALKRQALQQILAELQETIRLREAKEPMPTRLHIIGDSEILGPAQPMKRGRR